MTWMPQSVAGPTPLCEPMRPRARFQDPDFLELCDGCGDCVAVCPVGLLEMGRRGLPRLVDGAQDCLGCGLCADACTRGALTARAPAAGEARLRSARIGGGLAALLTGHGGH